MKQFIKRLTVTLAMIFTAHLVTAAQTTGSIAGTVLDANGAAVPSAAVTILGASGQKFDATTSDNGTFRVPAVGSGVYTITITAPNFKKSVIENVKVDVGLPTAVDVTLLVGEVSETIVIMSGGEILQTQTATVGTTITGRQIVETPISSRDALDLVTLLPGTASVGAPRRSSINGLPKGSLSISIDGVDVQDNLLRSSDGFFTYVRPRVDAIEEVTVSTSNPGAESSGDGAVQIKFVTRRGTNDYRGGVFMQHRNTDLNAAYWYNNRDLKPLPGDDKAPRNKIILNQYGGRLGGPIPFLNFCEGCPIFNSGKDRAFFFFNYEQFRQPESQTRNRVILSPEAQSGIYRYTGGPANGVNLLQVATANGRLATIDPTVGRLLSQIRTSATGEGSITPISNSLNIQNFNFTPSGLQIRKFLALRFDFNLNKNNSLEFVTNRQRFVPSKDFLNSQDERFPGLPFYKQGSERNSYSGALRSTFGTNIVNEARYAVSTGFSEFSPGISSADYSYQGGYDLGINAVSFGGTALTTATARNSYSGRNTPTYDFTDTITVVAGSHNISFGGQYKLIKAESTAIGRIVPTVSFGVDSTEGLTFTMFNATNLPGSTTAQQAEARALYAVLVGRVSGYTSTAYLTSAGTYELNSTQDRLSKQNTYGLFVQDSWRVNQNFTLNYGVRWQPQTAFVILSDNYAKLETFDQLYGVSGLGNIFKPGTLTGTVPRVVAVKKGEKAYPDDFNNFAPTVGAVWSPDFGDTGFMRGIFGASGRSVFRGGYSVSFVREGFDLLGSIYGANPGGTLSASRNLTIPGSFTVGTNLRDLNNPNLTPNTFSASPSYPITLGTADSTNAFDPNLKTGSVRSFSFGYQREIDKDTVVEFRYVGNRGKGLQRQYNINEFNTIENGFAAEFALAQANLYANIAAGRGASFAYFGAGTGTSPLPIALSYFNTAANYAPNDATKYSATNFANTVLVSALSRNAPSIIGFGSGANYENNAARRANALANGRPSNFFYVNPATGVNGSFVVDNSTDTSYDSGVFEIRRRLSDGLRLQANYVWSKAQSNAFQSSSVVFAGFTQRESGLDLAQNVQAFDIRHQFKFDATYDLPLGKGRKFFSGSNAFMNALVGGWTILPSVRWQSGSPFSLGNVQLVGMTVKDLQKEIKVRKGASVVTYLPDDIITNTQKAFNIDVTNTANNGYGTTYGTGGPQGRFIAPAGYGNCQQRFTGECGFNNLILYGPGFFKFDVTMAKKFIIDEKRNIELKATFLDALNMPNFRVGGWNVDVASAGTGLVSGVSTGTFGQLLSGSAYQDISTTNDPGGRLIDVMLRINF